VKCSSLTWVNLSDRRSGQDLIRLSGYEAGKDIEIVVYRPDGGEKLHEELFRESERIERSTARYLCQPEYGAGLRRRCRRLAEDVATLLASAHNGNEARCVICSGKSFLSPAPP